MHCDEESCSHDETALAVRSSASLRRAFHGTSPSIHAPRPLLRSVRPRVLRLTLASRASRCVGNATWMVRWCGLDMSVPSTSLARVHPRGSATKQARMASLCAMRGTCRRREVRCQAVPRRVERVSRQLEREVGELLRSDKVMRRAVCPNEAAGHDLALSAMASVTQVELSRDMQVARVYVSLFSDDQGKQTAMANLSKLQGYTRKEIGRRMRLRMVPEVRFVFDDTFERSSRVLGLLDRIEQAREGGTAMPPPPIALAQDEEESANTWDET